MNLLEIRAKSYSIVFALVVPLLAVTGTAHGAAAPPFQAASEEPGDAADRAAELVRRGWAAGEPAERRRLAAEAIALLEAMRRAEPDDRRALGDLVLAYRLAERMEEVVALWEGLVDRAAAPYWLVTPAADAYLALGRLDEAERHYRRLAEMRPEAPEPWLGLYWTAVEDRRFADARRAVERLAELPGEAWTARLRAAWLLLYEDRTAAGLDAFEELLAERPDDAVARQGLATARRWLGRPRGALDAVDEIARRAGAAAPDDLPPAVRIVRAGALADLGALGAARREATALVALVPENLHARRLERDVDALLSPEARIEARWDTSDRGFGELWSHLAVDVPLGTRARLGAGLHASRAEDEREAAGDVEQAFVGLSVRPADWLLVSAEAAHDLGGGFDRDPSFRLRTAFLPSDRWRFDLGAVADGWRDLPLRARSAGLVADAWDAGATYTAARWHALAAAGRADHSDGNERTWGRVAGERQTVAGPFYRAAWGVELWASENSRSDVPYFSPESDRSAALVHRSEWVPVATPERRWVIGLHAQAGVYEQEGFDVGAVGALWLRSDLDLAGRAVLLVEAGARSQLYDGERETLPRVAVLVRRRF